MYISTELILSIYSTSTLYGIVMHKLHIKIVEIEL